jgi:hypothetical protein
MRKMIITLAATAALASSAFAQTATTTTTPGTATPAPAETVVGTMGNSDVFVTATPADILSYNLVGLNIHNSEDTAIGEIKDLILSNGELAGYIVSVGGFLGIGERHVIVNPSAVTVTYNEADSKWDARMETTKEVLQAAPEFKYEGRWAR